MDFSQRPVTALRGVGQVVAEKLARLGIHNLQDLLFHLPFRYEDRTRLSSLSKLRVGDKGLIEGVVGVVSLTKIGKTRLVCELREGSRRINLRFFHIYPAHQQQLKEGARVLCFGELSWGKAGLEMIHPEWQVLDQRSPPVLEDHLRPVYPSTEGVSQNLFRKLIRQLLEKLEQTAFIEELLPATLLKKQGWGSLKEALLFIHRPPAEASTPIDGGVQQLAQQRIAFEELLAHRLGLLKLKQAAQSASAFRLSGSCEKAQQLIKALPFELTAAQKRVSAEIAEDLKRSHPMLRLVQGDVGSGKTVVAALAILRALESGAQAALMAPTELLAEQHYHSFQQWFEPLEFRVAYLSGQVKGKERRDIMAALAEGQIAFVVGTHALFQKEVQFSNLALIVVDEQHRFGVQQRALLREKGMKAESTPHQLIMTATPIPRTLAMSFYADLDCSIIDELPKGRQAIKTTVLANTKRNEVIAHLRKACQGGRQAYWVCPLIEESDELVCQAVEKVAEEFKRSLPELRIGLVHGRKDHQAKEEGMRAFKSQALDLLIATTVIEVGVDVPNASLMIIENAERLGLSQLHQLRGRVGRGSLESHCLLIYQAPLSAVARQRLSAIRETQDGFLLAEQDLKLRGPGDVLGTRQTGELTFRIAELLRDSALLPTVIQTATELLKTSPEKAEQLIQRWLGQRQQYSQV